MPDISVIIPVYNTGEILLETVNSVLEQSYSGFELIIVDDGSNPETQKIISSLQDDRIRVIRQENSGVASARNTGVSAAQGRYIALLDHDDLWHKDKLYIQKKLLDEDLDAVLVYSSVEPFGSSDTIQIPDYPVISGNVFLSELEQNKIHSTSCVMFRRSTVMENAVRFVTEMVPCDDWHFYLHLARFGKFLHSAAVPVYYRLHSGNQSSNVAKMYHAGLRVLDDTVNNAGVISSETSVPISEILQTANRHKAKHLRGLANKAYAECDYRAACGCIRSELKGCFSFKACAIYCAVKIISIFR